MILVTGATSQVGIVLLKRLVEEGYKVRCLVRAGSELSEIRQLNVELLIGDVENKDALKHALEGIEHVVHIAGIWRARQLLEVCSESSSIKKLIFIGSTSRFKKLDSIDEKERILAESMAESEKLINDSCLNTIILRPTMLYGINKDKNILQIISFMKKFRFYPLIGHGRGLKHPVYVGDVVNAIVLCLTNGNLVKKDYIIAGKSPVRYIDMLKTIKKHMGRTVILLPVPVIAGYAAVFLYKLLKPATYINYAMIKRVNEDMAYDITPAVSELGYEPVSFEEGIQKQVQYLREKQLL